MDKFDRKLKDERKKLKEQNREVRKVVISDFFTDFTKFFRPWLHELARKYKERGDFPVMAAWLLPSYYTDTKDVEVAAYAAMLIRNDEKVVDHVSDFRRMLGDRPSEWFEGRGFVALSIGDTQTGSTGGVRNSRIAEYFDKLYEVRNSLQNITSIVFAQIFGVSSYWNKLHMIRLILGTSDGIGKGVWAIVPHDLRCPLTGDVMYIVKTFFPDYKKVGRVEDVLKLFGFEVESDLFYAALAYKELQKINPKGCSRLATLYQKRYKECNILERKYWDFNKRDGILPEIRFE